VILRGGLAPLGYRDYALFWAGFFASNAGRWIEMTGSLWLVSQLSDSPILLGGLGLVRAAPAILLSPVAGVFADRFDHRRLLFVTQGLSMLLSLALAASIAAGTIAVWQIYLQLAIQACVQPFDLASRQTLFPRLVPKSELPGAVTLTLAAARLAKTFGPAIGGIAIATFGPAAPYLFNAFSFLALMFAIVAIGRLPRENITSRKSFAADLREGLAEVRGTPLISGIIQLEAVFGLLSVNQVMITIVAQDILGTGPEGLGLLLAAPALGSVVGLTALVAFGQARRQGRVAILAIMAYGAVMAVIAGSAAFTITFCALAVTGLLDAWVTVVRQSIIQLTAPGAMRGRLVANMAVVSTGMGPLSQVGSGALTASVGAAPGILITAIALVGVSSAVVVRNRALWLFEHRRQDRDPPTMER
jgi:MFS family permease